MNARVVSEEEGIEWVLRVLSGGGRLTTRQIEEVGAKEGIACPDSTARFLSGMRHRGLIEGEISVKDKGWVWWRKTGA